MTSKRMEPPGLTIARRPPACTLAPSDFFDENKVDMGELLLVVDPHMPDPKPNPSCWKRSQGYLDTWSLTGSSQASGPRLLAEEPVSTLMNDGTLFVLEPAG